MLFNSRGKETDGTVLVSAEVDGAEKLAIQALAYANAQAQEEGFDIDYEVAAKILGLMQAGIEEAHQRREQAMNLGLGRFRLKPNLLSRIPFLINATPLADQLSSPSEKGWTIRRTEVASGKKILSDGNTKLIRNFAEIDLTSQGDIYFPGVRYKSGMVITDSIHRAPNGDILPLLILKLGHGNFQSFIGDAPEHAYTFEQRGWTPRSFRLSRAANTLNIAFNQEPLRIF